jgi:hypothetical protein
MIVRFLEPSSTFGAVFYSTDKMGLGKAELMDAVNFDALNGLDEIRPADYRNHLKAVSSLNKEVSQPQLHVAISTTGRSHDKHELTVIAKAWLEKMGYARQPYLIFFHRDTEQNHVHIVSTRIGHEGRKISSAFEHVRAVKALNQIMGLEENKTVQKDLERAMSYRFSTLAQFKLILERQGYTIKDNDLIKFGKKLAEFDFGKVEFREPDQRRAAQLKAIFKKYASLYDAAGFAEYMKTKMGVELVFHSKDGKPAYGYTVIDHAQKNIYKGSEIIPLKELLSLANTHQAQPISENTTENPKIPSQRLNIISQSPSQHFQPISQTPDDASISINIANDVDDEAIHGPRRRRKKKARTNQR